MYNKNSPQPVVSPFKKLFFGGVFSLFILLVLEFFLSFANLEKYDHEFIPKSSYPVFVKGKGELAGLYVSNDHFSEFLNWQTFPLKKDAGTFRIFVIGGSAAYAWPYVDTFGFTGHLRRAFDNVMPEKVQVINAAGMSYGSHRVLDILQDVLLLKPDLVVVLSGNNEYVERNILPDPQKSNPAIEKISVILGQTNTYRAVRLGLLKTFPGTFHSPQKTDITDIRSNPELERGSLGRTTEIDREVLRNYKTNITSIKELLVKHKVKGIFCTVPVNIGGWIPTVDNPKFTSENAASQWMELYKLKEEAFQKGNIRLEAKYLEEMLTITPGDPGMRFNYGKVLWNLRSFDASYQELVKAKDYDVRPIRALSSFNETIRTLVNKKQGIYLADLEKNFRDLYYNQFAESLFIDYCHFTDFGHKTVARMLLPVLQKALDGDFPLKQLEQHIVTDKMSLSKDNKVQATELYARAITLHNNRRIAESIETYKKILAQAPDTSAAIPKTLSNLGSIYLENGNREEAKAMYLKAVELRPENIGAIVSLGLISVHENNIEKAEHYFLKAYSINPYTPSATFGLAEVAVRQGETKLAIEYFEKTLQLGRDHYALRRGLGEAYINLGDKENALRQWKSALKFRPNDQEVKALVEEYSQN